MLKKNLHGVATSNLLHDLRASSNEHSPEVLGRPSRQNILLSASLGSLEGVENDASLVQDDVRVEGSGLEGGNDTLGFSEVSMRNEPTRRLGEKLDHDEKADGEDALKGDGDAPRSRGRDEGESIVNPLGTKGGQRKPSRSDGAEAHQ